ncbi:MAG: aminotransferase class I/II-fold pyridoxal phosphate-dependent enzyme [Rhizomicrobium sp.]
MSAIDTFVLERSQSLYENTVEINLTESGVEPLTLETLLSPAELAELHKLRLGYNYTEGTPELRAAIATWYPGARAENVLVTTGAAEANFLAAWALLSPKDTLAFMVPNFMQLHGLGRNLGATVKTFPLDPRKGWQLDRAAFGAAAKGATLIALCNPNNPSGAVLSRADMDVVAATAKAENAWLLCDEIYRGSEIDGRAETPSFWGATDRTIVTSSTSKSLAHAGLRLGWIVAPPDFIYECMRRQDYTTIGTGPINQFLGAKLLAPARRNEILARSRAILARNLGVIDGWISRWNGRLAYDRPAAGGMVFVRYDVKIGSAALSDLLREKKGTFVVAGEWFGMDGHLRIGTGGHAHELEEGLRRIDDVLRAIA